jgi:stage II sporulation protein D
VDALRVALGLAAVALLAPPRARAGETVRIAVATAQRRVVLAGPALTVAPLAEGRERRPVPGGRAELTLEGEELALGGEPLDAPAASFAAEGPIRAGALDLAGEVEVRRGAGGLDVVHAVPMEEYVAAVVEAEMPAAFPPEALKAQAVAARSFALARKIEAVAEGRSWHLGATVLDQVYRAGRDPRARAAAAATAGEVLAREHEPVLAFFHAACGGRTERGADALGQELPYLASVPCDRCRPAPRWRWTVRVGAAELGRLAGLPGPATAARVAARTGSGRAARVAVEARRARVELGAADLRQRLGFDRLPSLAFDVKVAGGEAVFAGRGAGHGSGMCQWGAAGLARQGRDYRAILGRYYPGTEIVRMY